MSDSTQFFIDCRGCKKKISVDNENHSTCLSCNSFKFYIVRKVGNRREHYDHKYCPNHSNKLIDISKDDQYNAVCCKDCLKSTNTRTNSQKKIKDCSECQQEIQVYLKNAYYWETKKKEVLNNKIQSEPCLKEVDFNLGHRGSIEKALEKYKTIPSNSQGSRISVSPMCNKCGAIWHNNEYGDETGDKSLNDNTHICQNQANSNFSNNNINQSSNIKNTTVEREREREREREHFILLQKKQYQIHYFTRK